MKRLTSAVYRHPDRPGEGAKKRRGLMPKDKIETVMGEYKRGTLRSGSGAHVTSKKQAIAIALSEARRRGRLGATLRRKARRAGKGE